MFQLKKKTRKVMNIGNSLLDKIKRKEKPECEKNHYSSSILNKQCENYFMPNSDICILSPTLKWFDFHLTSEGG